MEFQVTQLYLSGPWSLKAISYSLEGENSVVCHRHNRNTLQNLPCFNVSIQHPGNISPGSSLYKNSSPTVIQSSEGRNSSCSVNWQYAVTKEVKWLPHFKYKALDETKT